MPLTLYHNPRCSKSRQALALLQEASVEAQVVEYLKTPPDAAALDALCRTLGCEPQAIIRFKEARAKELGLAPDDDRSRAQWLQLIAENPILLERPIAVREDRAVVGRPPENLRQLL